MVEKRVKMAEQEAVENAARNQTGAIANTLQTDSMVQQHIIHVEDELYPELYSSYLQRVHVWSQRNL